MTLGDSDFREAVILKGPFMNRLTLLFMGQKVTMRKSYTLYSGSSVPVVTAETQISTIHY